MKFDILSKVKDTKAAEFITKHGSKVIFKVKKASPEILVGTGVVMMVVGAGIAVKKTFEAPDVIEEVNTELEAIHKDREEKHEEVYSQMDYKKDLFKGYFHAGTKFAKLYGSALTFETLGVICILSGHNIMRKRNAALLGAYTVLDESFKTYRGRVKEAFGEAVEKRIFTGAEEKEIEEEVVNEKGKKKIEKKVIDTLDGPVEYSVYAKMFDETLRGQGTWKPDASYNMMFLKQKQNYFNDRLQVYGYVFLNDVYKELGFEPTSMGQIVGWLRDGNGDGFIDFGIYDHIYTYSPNSEFINGLNPSIMLDFNVDGVIYDKI